MPTIQLTYTWPSLMSRVLLCKLVRQIAGRKHKMWNIQNQKPLSIFARMPEVLLSNLILFGIGCSKPAFTDGEALSRNIESHNLVQPTQEMEGTADTTDVDRQVEALHEKKERLESQRLELLDDAQRQTQKQADLETRLAATKQEARPLEQRVPTTELPRSIAANESPRSDISVEGSKQPAQPATATVPLPLDLFKRPQFIAAFQSLDFAPLYKDRVLTRYYLQSFLELFNSQEVLDHMPESKRLSLKQLQDRDLGVLLKTYIVQNPDFFTEYTNKQSRPFLDAVSSMAESRRNHEDFLTESFKALGMMTKTLVPLDIMTKHGQEDALILAHCAQQSPDAIRKVLGGIRFYLSGSSDNSEQGKMVAIQALGDYLESIPERIVADVEQAAKTRKLDRLIVEISDIALLIRALSLTKSAGDNSNRSKQYSDRLSVAFESLTRNNYDVYVHAIASLCYIGEQSKFSAELQTIVEGFDLTNDHPADDYLADDHLAVLAAAGRYEGAVQMIEKFRKELPCDRARIYLAIVDAENDRFEKAEEHCRIALADKRFFKWGQYEGARAFCLLCETFASRGQLAIAKELITLHPSRYYRVVARAYAARGGKDGDQLRTAISELRSLEDNESGNSAVLEVGLIAASMKLEDEARSCLDKLNKTSQRQHPIILLSSIAQHFHSDSDLLLAKSKFSALPTTATGARQDAIVALALAECALTEGTPEQLLALGRVSALDPHYRVRFHLRLLGIHSRRFYGTPGTE